MKLSKNAKEALEFFTMLAVTIVICFGSIIPIVIKVGLTFCTWLGLPFLQ